MVVFPCAKINIGLYVTEKRTDGYHNIETLFHPIGLSDVLEVVRDRNLVFGSVELKVSGLIIEGNPGTNLVVRAYHMLHDRVGLPGVRVYLHKCIPAGAGLGGGSSDGASMLLTLNRIFDLNLSDCDLFSLALKLGSDCPYFIDPVPSFAKGRGEDLIRANINLSGYHILLFHPGTGISTAHAYRNVRVGEPDIPLGQLEKLPVTEWKDAVRNAFEPHAFEQQPVIEQVKNELYFAGALYASMTGSGSAVYGLFDHEPGIPADILKYLIWKERF
jgi:4-diphosphocytidyl-2-C-methyl-D-erythritol kinase